MKWVSENQTVSEWDPVLTTHTDPGPLHTVIAGFAPYGTDMKSLDIDGWIELTVLADFIVKSFDPGCLPVVGVYVIGHADAGLKPDKAYEQKISVERAKVVQQFLKKEVESKGWTFSPVKVPDGPPSGTPTIKAIDWKAPRGVGASQPDPDNVKLKKISPHMTEADRKRNRRVEIVLEFADSPIPVPLNNAGAGKTDSGSPGTNPPGQPPSPGSSTQIIFGYTLIPKGLQTATGPPDPLNPLATQHQFSFTITRADHPKDSGGLERSVQGSVTINDKGDIVNIQAGAQVALVTQLLGGWIQLSGFVQLMASLNWSKTVSGQAIVVPVVQPAIGGQIIVTPNFSGGPFKFLNGRVQVGIQAMATGNLPAVPPPVAPFAPGPSGGASVGGIVNIPFDWP